MQWMEILGAIELPQIYFLRIVTHIEDLRETARASEGRGEEGDI